MTAKVSRIHRPQHKQQAPFLSGDFYGWQDCAAWVGRMWVDAVTLGKSKLGLRTVIDGEGHKHQTAAIRAMSNEPIPHTNSASDGPDGPGLDHVQVATVLRKLGHAVTVLRGVPVSRFRADMAHAKGRRASVSVWYGALPESDRGQVRADFGHELLVQALRVRHDRLQYLTNDPLRPSEHWIDATVLEHAMIVYAHDHDHQLPGTVDYYLSAKVPEIMVAA